MKTSQKVPGGKPRQGLKTQGKLRWLVHEGWCMNTQGKARILWLICGQES